MTIVPSRAERLIAAAIASGARPTARGKTIIATEACTALITRDRLSATT